MKKIRRLIIIALILLPVAAYAMIAAANNRIADDLEQALLAYPLPQDTEIMDSVSVAAKVSGNGNGMQYFGAILVKSELSEEELQAYYDNCCEKADYAEVVPQETEYLFEYMPYRFDKWEASEDVYRIGLWIHSVAGCEDSTWEALLNCDIRGH